MEMNNPNWESHYECKTCGDQIVLNDEFVFVHRFTPDANHPVIAIERKLDDTDLQEAADAMQAQAGADEYDSRMLFEDGLHE
jgi:hypothetical protein